MNTSDFRDSGTSKDGGAAPSGPLMSALTTEHYTLQSARTATILEANGRSQLFLSAVSGATVALALVAQLWAVSLGVLAAIGVLAVLLIDQKRRWSNSAEQAPCLFPSDDTPATPGAPPAGPNRSWTAGEQAARTAFHPAADRLFV